MHGGPKKGPHKVKIYWYDYPCWGYIWFPLRREYQVHTYTHTQYISFWLPGHEAIGNFITSLVSVRLQLVSTFCNLKLQNVPFLSIMQLTLSKTEMGQIWSTSVLAEVIKSRFLSFEWYFNQLFPTFTYCINFDIVYRYDTVNLKIFSLCKRIYSWQELRPNYESVLSVRRDTVPGNLPILSSPFSWVIATYYISIIINGLVMYKITFSRHLHWFFMLHHVVYTFLWF